MFFRGSWPLLMSRPPWKPPATTAAGLHAAQLGQSCRVTQELIYKLSPAPASPYSLTCCASPCSVAPVHATASSLGAASGLQPPPLPNRLAAFSSPCLAYRRRLRLSATTLSRFPGPRPFTEAGFGLPGRRCHPGSPHCRLSPQPWSPLVPGSATTV